MSGMLTAVQLREKRANIYKQGEEILKGAQGRALTAEEDANFRKVHEDLNTLKAQIDAIETFEAEGRAMEASKAETREVTEAAAKRGDEGAIRAQKQADAHAKWLRGGALNLTAEERKLLGVTATESGQEITLRMRTAREARAAQTVTTTGGGYLIPQGFSNTLEESLLAYGGMETVSTVLTTETGNTLPYPTFDDTAQTGALLAINTQASEQAITYGQISLSAYKFSSKYVTVPVELMQDSAFDVDSHVASVLGTRLGRVHNTYWTTGTGSSQPQGIVAGASSALTAAGTSTVTFDELLSLVHGVDPAYRQPGNGPGFVLNDGSLLKLRQVKDSDGQPLWQAGLQGGAPDRILGYPYLINQDMAAMTTGLKPVLFGALRKFLIRKVKDVTILRLNEIKADYHQVVFIGFSRMDSKVLDAGTDPVKYITMA